MTGLRTQRVAALEIRPARIDAAARQLVVATRLAVRVDFAGPAGPTGAPPPAVEPAFEGVYRDLLVNYESARAFRRPPGGRAALRRIAPTGAGVGTRSAPLGFDVARDWIRVAVDRKGVQEITGADLAAAGASLAGVDPAQLRLFTRPGVPLLDERVPCDTCGLAEVAMRVDDGGDGRLDPDDRILFFGLGASGWRDDYTGPGGAPSEWLDHPYETANVYWLSWDAQGLPAPARWTARDVAPARADAWPAPFYAARLHFEEDHAYDPDMQQPGRPWDPWAWQYLNSSMADWTAAGDAAGAVVDRPVHLRASWWGPPNAYGGPLQLAATFNGLDLSIRPWYSGFADLDTVIAGPVDGPNLLAMRVLGNPLDPYGFETAEFLSWELRFARRFQATDDSLEFAAADTTAPVAYSLAPFSTFAPESLALLDVTDPLRPVELTGWSAADTAGGGAIHFQDQGSPRAYFAATARRFARPALERADVRDVRTGGADYVVICPDALEPEAQRLAAHRRLTAPPVPGATTAVVRLSDILAWYAGGRMDPVAIRDFLRAAVVGGGWSPAPSYACLLGDATYDFRNRSGLGDPALARAQLPTFGHLLGAVGGYSSDDWFADLDPDSSAYGVPIGAPDVIVGRLPAANPTEAVALVDKVTAYDAAPELGPWRSRMLYLVDDVKQGTQPDPIGGGHIQQADSLERTELPAFLEPDKVSLIEYPFTQGTAKGGAHDAAVRELNRGSVLWHFIGHGSPYQLADEKAFTIDDVAALANGPRQPFFLPASCSVGPFDSPVATFLAERLIKRADGGAIASLAGTELTFASTNFDLTCALYPLLLEPPEEGGARTIGEAVFAAKRRAYASPNDRLYNLLGDPALRLGAPRHDVRLRLYDDATGVALGDSLPRGRRVRVEAELRAARDTTSALLRGFAGRASVHVTDAPPLLPYPLDAYGFGGSSLYLGNPRPVYDGQAAVSGGTLTARFVVPVYAALGARARVEVYAEDGATDASGTLLARVVAGDTSFADTSGPAIALRFASGGPVVGPGEALTVVLEDPSGLHALDDSTAEAIQVSIDGAPPRALAPAFAYDPGSCTRGAAAFTLPGLADGPHALQVSAADALARPGVPGNRSTARFAFTVARIVDQAPLRAIAFPNPFLAGAGTRLVFTGTAPGATAEVDLFSVAGRLVRRLAGRSDTGHLDVDWDGRDASGRGARAGVYFYRARLRAPGGAVRTHEGRLVLLP